MPNTVVPAAATGLPKSRRTMLGLFVAAPAAMMASAKSTPAALAAGADDAELFALATEIDAADAALNQVDKVHSAAEDAFFEARPRAPTEPASPDRSNEEGTIALRRKMAEGEVRGPSSERVAYEAAVEQHEERCERLKVDCGVEAAERSQEEADGAVIELRDRLIEIQATTLAGLIFKARYAAEHYPGDPDPRVVDSILDDLIALSEEEAPNV